MEDLTKCLVSAVVGAVLALAAFLCVARCTGGHEPDSEPVVVRDTMIVHDTIRVDKPVPRYIRTTDTIRVKVPVAEVLRDTIYVTLSREEKVYEDSTYRAQVSGYEPHLDFIEVYPRTITITEKVTERARRKPWGIGVHAGYGAALDDGRVILSPYIGVGISYNILTF